MSDAETIEDQDVSTDCSNHVHLSADRDEQSSKQFAETGRQHLKTSTLVGFTPD